MCRSKDPTGQRPYSTLRLALAGPCLAFLYRVRSHSWASTDAPPGGGEPGRTHTDGVPSTGWQRDETLGPAGGTHQHGQDTASRTPAGPGNLESLASGLRGFSHPCCFSNRVYNRGSEHMEETGI